MIRPYLFWPWCSGLIVLVVGVVVRRRALVAARGLEALVLLGPVFVAAPLATFGAEHFTLTSEIQGGVPAWMPARLFLTYFVGVCLYLAAISLTVRRHVLLTGSLLALMFAIFVATIHVPNAIRVGDRLTWIVALRDLSFGAGALALAGTWTDAWRTYGSSGLATAGRLVVAIALVAFGVAHLLHPLNAPGVPLAKMTPPWIPFPAAWGYVTGAIEVVGGGLMLANIRGRQAATYVGLAMTWLVLIIYLPLVFTAVEPGQGIEAENYVWDTLLFAGTVLLVAGATRRRAV